MIKAYAALEPAGSLVPFEYDPGELGSREVELDVLYAGICHTDLSMIDNAWGFTQYPLVAGHEVVGRVASLGKDVSSLKIGDIVGLGFHAGYCLECEACDVGDHNFCSSAKPTMFGRHGGFADKVRADEKSLIPIPDGIDLVAAGPLFCAGVTVFNPFIEFDIKPSDKVAVIGIGGLGHLALQVANAWGCEVTAFTTSETKAMQARSLGAHHTLNTSDPAQIAGAAGKFDLILSTVDVPLDWRAYLRTLKPRGRLNFVGASVIPMQIAPMDMMTNQLSVSSSSVGSPATMRKMLEFFQRHKIKAMIETFYFDEINDAIDRLRSGKVYYRIVLQNRNIKLK
ncbi:alcohol dehydrogenase [Croceicoccus estronivorus]|uniref:NAD(P)-dependent alcohol dehydrogenase n=1 Tax=Croceicoccus estronivorus TaxID=1172626 RepID=UPI00082D0305|nr:NAD(P)-dependent alcohol dehydrogenase [Croceicoccus estronivorus]OCC22891.1 alcohol dehydrogenase [Croceicoccus estronivorus]